MQYVLLLALALLVVFAISALRQGSAKRAAQQLDDELARARQVTERLGGQIYGLTGTDTASKQALADASERFTAASSQVDLARTPVQARLARETAIEGLYYVRAAREAMGIDPGPAVPALDGHVVAGAVTEDRTVEYEGRTVEASPKPSARTPNYYPGGVIAGRPVPTGWYSEPWWRPALVAGAWGVGASLLFSSLFTGMSGAENAAMDPGAYGGDFGGDVSGNAGDVGGDGGGDFGGFDGGGFDGGDFGGFDF